MTSAWLYNVVWCIDVGGAYPAWTTACPRIPPFQRRSRSGVPSPRCVRHSRNCFIMCSSNWLRICQCTNSGVPGKVQDARYLYHVIWYVHWQVEHTLCWNDANMASLIMTRQQWYGWVSPSNITVGFKSNSIINITWSLLVQTNCSTFKCKPIRFFVFVHDRLKLHTTHLTVNPPNLPISLPGCQIQSRLTDHIRPFSY